MRLLRLAIFAAALLVVIIALSACGKKGAPVRPGEVPPAEESEENLF